MREELSIPNVDSGLSEIILPSQFFGAMGSRGLGSEQRLMLAVLVDAINAIRRWRGVGGGRRRQAFAEATHWINTQGIGCPFSFDGVCEALGIDSKNLRCRLTGLIERRPSAVRIAGRSLPLKESGRVKRVTIKRARRRRKQIAAVAL